MVPRSIQPALRPGAVAELRCGKAPRAHGRKRVGDAGVALLREVIAFAVGMGGSFVGLDSPTFGV